MTKWFNVISNIVYPIVGYTGDTLTLICGIYLCLGSAWMHYEQEFYGYRSDASILADWTGMYAFTLSVLAFHTTPYVLLLMLPIAFIGHDMRNDYIIGLLVILTILITQAWLSLVFFIPAAYIRARWENTRYQDWSHSLPWHGGTGAGYWSILKFGGL